MINDFLLGVQSPIEASSVGSEEELCEEEIQLARALLIVVFLFIFCQSFKIIPDLYEVIWCSQYYQEEQNCKSTPFIENVIDTSHFMLAINSSANFFIYVWYRGKFRQTIVNLVKRSKNNFYIAIANFLLTN